MRRYLFQSMVDYIALVISLFLITFTLLIRDSGSASVDIGALIQLNGSLLPAVFIFSTLMTAVHWFVRPLLVIVFGGWLIGSFGLFLIILDGSLFTAAVFLTPVQFQIPSAPWWGIPVSALLFNILDFVIATVVGLNRPRLDGKRAHEAAWRLLEQLPDLQRNWINEKLRLQEAFSTILSYGLEMAVAQTLIGPPRRWIPHLVYGKPNPMDHLSRPEKIRIMLEQLGPTYVKFGQMISSQSGILPSEWVVELAKLQSEVPPVSYERIREVILSELGSPPEELYATFEHDAFAAASTAQVHRATLHDGTLVAVKVQRPNIVATTKADLGVLQDLSKMLESVSGYARSLDLSGILAEFSDGVIDELDYYNEAYHAQRLARNLEALPLVHVPTVYPDLSATHVLTMEYINGVKVDKPGALDHPGIDRLALTEAFLRALVKQFFIDGFFHADPHPGNILFDLDRGALTYVDIGLVGRLDQNKRFELIDLLTSLQQSDTASLANLALRLTKKTGRVDLVQFRNDMTEMVDRYVRYTTYPNLNTIFPQFLALLQRYGLRLDKQFALTIKAITQSQATVVTLDEDFDFIPFAVQEIKSLALAEITQDKVLEALKLQATHVGKELLRRVPDLQDATVSWLNQYMQGKLIVHIDTQDLAQHVTALDGTLNKVTAGLTVTGMLIGTAIVTTQLPQLWPVFGISFFIAARLTWRVLNPPR